MGMGLNQHDCEDLASEQCIAALIETDRKCENSDFFKALAVQATDPLQERSNTGPEMPMRSARTYLKIKIV